MKRSLFAAVSAGVLALSLTACGGKDDPAPPGVLARAPRPQPAPGPPRPPLPPMARRLPPPFWTVWRLTVPNCTSPEWRGTVT